MQESKFHTESFRYVVCMILLSDRSGGVAAIPTNRVILAGVGCRCVDGARIIQDTGFYGIRTGTFPLECESCVNDQVPTKDGRSCISCPSEARSESRGCQCPPGFILVERNTNGRLLTTAKCVECTSGSQPSADGTVCEPCLFHPVLKDNKVHGCNCTLVGGLCLASNYRTETVISYTPTSGDSFVRFPASEKNIDSAFFKEHFLLDILANKPKAVLFDSQLVISKGNFKNT